MLDLLRMPPRKFIALLKQHSISRFYLVYDHDNKTCRASHDFFTPIAEFLQSDKRDYLEHEGIFVQVSQHYDILLCAFVHKTCRGQGAGGVRFWQYATLEDVLRDGIRLSAGMTRKNALSGLWWGGGKGVISRDKEINNSDPEIRATIFREYGEFMTSLQGCYVTAEDVGATPQDLAHIFSRTRFATCIPQEIGGSGNPSLPTARGVIRGMQAALKVLEESTLEGKTVVVQGMGHVGMYLIRFLFENNVGQVIAGDINVARVREVTKFFSGKNLRAIVFGEDDNTILSTPCDILAPCATGAILNARTIPAIQARIVCGAANNQLEDEQHDDEMLFARGILYVPDFLVNRMGIVNCANEQYGYVADDPFINRHLGTEWENSVYCMSLKVLQLAHEKKIPPARTAIALADELSQQPHPIFGHRGQQIIDSLVASNWQESIR